VTLGQKQRKFVRMVADLIIWAYDNGYELTFGDAYRDPRLHGQMGWKVGYGAASSCHKIRLAIDLNLFKEQPKLHPISGLWLVARDGMRRCQSIPSELLPEIEPGQCEEVEIVIKK